MAALIGIAAAVLVLTLRVDVRFDQKQIILGWGKPEPERIAAPPPPIVVRTESILPAELDERIAVLTNLIHVLAANVETNDRDRADELARMRLEVASLHQQSERQRKEMERTLQALYTAQFGARQ